MQVGEICTRDVLCAAPDTSVAAAAKLMRQYHSGTLVVVRLIAGQRAPVGIVTDRDIVLSVTAADLDPRAVTVAEVAPGDLVTAAESDEVFAVIERMREQGVRRMPIVDAAGMLVGIVSLDDVLAMLAGELTSLAHLVAREQLHERRARR